MCGTELTLSSVATSRNQQKPLNQNCNWYKHPSKIASYEILITPVACITSDNTSLSLEKSAIIELAKTIELSDKEANNKVILLCANSGSLEWRELGSECNCKILKDRISFEVTQYGHYTVAIIS